MEANLHTYSSRQAVKLAASGQGNLRRFATSGYIELGQFNGGSVAVRKTRLTRRLLHAQRLGGKLRGVPVARPMPTPAAAGTRSDWPR